jgi:hypothetical protein
MSLQESAFSFLSSSRSGNRLDIVRRAQATQGLVHLLLPAPTFRIYPLCLRERIMVFSLSSVVFN